MNTQEHFEEFKDLSQIELNNHFKVACFNGEFERVKYLLTSTDLTEHAEIDFLNHNGLKCACMHGYLEIVKYLLSSPDLKEHGNIYAGDALAFKYVCMEDNLELKEYIIFDYKVERTDAINDYLEKFPNELIDKMFNIRELNKQMHSELPIKGIVNNKKNKI
jgi:hypothetical protein